MARIARYITLALLVVPAAGASADKSKTIDMRNDDTVLGKYVVFISKRAVEGKPVGHAVAALATGDDPDNPAFEGGYGLYMEDQKQKVGPVSPGPLAKLREDEDTLTLIVMVDDEQFEKTRELIAKWTAEENEVDSPDMIALDFTMNVLHHLGMKLPFRYIRSDPITYYEDMYKLNRGLKKDS